MRRYDIEAKRKNTDEEWSAWATAENYYKALKRAEHVEKVGYEGRLLVHPEVREMWEILEDSYGGIKVTTDVIFDAGFRKASVVKEETTRAVTRKVAKKILSEIADAFEQYGGQYGMKQKILELEQEYGIKNCTDCEYFVGCEMACGGRICGEFEKKKSK